MTFTIPDVPVNNSGLATEYHIADRHQNGGEITLCGLFIDYTTWLGTAEGAPACQECKEKDT